MQKEKMNSLVSYNNGYLLKGLCILMILLVHSINEYPFYTTSISKIILIPYYGELGCSLFFFMSGYGMFLSLNKRQEITLEYIWNHLKPFIEVYIFTFISDLLICFVKGYSNLLSISTSNLITLSLPDGTDIWFFKAIIIDYLILFVLYKWNRKFLVYKLLLIFVLGIIIAWYLKLPGYTFVSQLSFPTGAFIAYKQPSKIGAKKCLLVSSLLFTIYYISLFTIGAKTPNLILGNTSFALIIVLISSLYVSHTIKIIQYIGKQSLYFYMFNIPIMLSIDSSIMHWPLYFLANLVCTFLIVYIFIKFKNYKLLWQK